MRLTLAYQEAYQGAEITVWNVQGVKLDEFSLQPNKARAYLQVANLPIGLYLLKIVKVDGTVELVRFIKQ